MNYNKDICILEIINWDKYHPRKDYKSIPWVRINNDIFEDPIWARLPRFSILVWIYLLTVCGRSNSARACFQVRLAAFATRLTPVSIRQVIDGLEQLQKVTVIERTWSPKLTNVKRSLRNETKKHETIRNLNKSSDDDTPPPKLVDLWNTNAASNLPRVKGINPTRLRKIRAAWKGKPDEKYWVSVIEAVNKSGFCTGKNERGWVANFDWMCKTGVPDKLLEGDYSGTSGGQKSDLPDGFFDFLKQED